MKAVCKLVAVLALAVVVLCDQTVFSGTLTPTAVVPANPPSADFGIFWAYMSSKNILTYYLQHNIASVTAVQFRTGTSNTFNGPTIYSFPTVTANKLLTGTIDFTAQGEIPTFFYNNTAYIEIFNASSTTSGVIRSSVIFSPFPVTYVGVINAAQVPGGSSNPITGLFIGSASGLNVGMNLIINAVQYVDIISSYTINAPKDCSSNSGAIIRNLNIGNTLQDSFPVASQSVIDALNAGKGYVTLTSNKGDARGNVLYATNFYGDFNYACSTGPTTAAPTTTSSVTTVAPSPSSSSSLAISSLVLICIASVLVSLL